MPRTPYYGMILPGIPGKTFTGLHWPPASKPPALGSHIYTSLLIPFFLDLYIRPHFSPINHHHYTPQPYALCVFHPPINPVLSQTSRHSFLPYSPKQAPFTSSGCHGHCTHTSNPPLSLDEPQDNQNNTGHPQQPDRDKHWWVQGHMRWQPCGPKRQQRKPIYIAAHVKGNTSKPLYNRPAVRLVRE